MSDDIYWQRILAECDRGGKQVRRDGHNWMWRRRRRRRPEVSLKFAVDADGFHGAFGSRGSRLRRLARAFSNAATDRQPTHDSVSMEWFAARDQGKEVRIAPAIVVVHESGRRMTVGRLIARGLSSQGLHAFLLHLPGYGPRRAADASDVERMLPVMQQAIADVRRARDAVVALPTIDDSVVGVQGTSLGGFVTATVAGIDAGYDRVFILMAGGDLQHVVLHGSKDAAKMRKRLNAAGMTDEQIKELACQVEPLRLAKRINSAKTWLYSGKFDDVVPPSCSQAIAKAAQLPASHHIELPVDHYSGILYLPMVIQQIQKRMIEPLEVPPQDQPSNPR